MLNLVGTELLKLKRAKMFTVSLVGAVAAPIMMFIAFMNMRNRSPDEVMTFELSFYNTNMYGILLIDTLLYGVITSYLFHREYAEDTLKNLLTIPVSRTSVIVSKLILLFLWILVLTLTAWTLTLALGVLGQFEGLSAAVLLQSLLSYLSGAILMFLLSTPTMFVTLWYKNYVPTIIFTAVVTMFNVALADREYSALFPWSAVNVIVCNSFFPEYPPFYSYAGIGVTAVAGFIATMVYFNRTDVQ